MEAGMEAGMEAANAQPDSWRLCRRANISETVRDGCFRAFMVYALVCARAVAHLSSTTYLPSFLSGFRDGDSGGKESPRGDKWRGARRYLHGTTIRRYRVTWMEGREREREQRRSAIDRS